MRLPLLGEISFSQQGKALRASTPQRTVLQPDTEHPYKEGKVTSTGRSAKQYWLISVTSTGHVGDQYWFAYPSPLLVVAAFRYSYICDRRRLHHHPTTGR